MGKLKIGVDVPWVTSWSGEQVLGVGPCPSIDGGLAVGQALRPGAGEPVWPSNHLFRQRKSVRELLCPMCGKPTPQGDRWTQTARWTTAGEVRGLGLGAWLPVDFKDDRPLLDAGAIAPMHRACAERARTACPHLAALPDQDLQAFPPAWIVVPLTIEARPPAAHANVPQRGVPAVTFLQLIGVGPPPSTPAGGGSRSDGGRAASGPVGGRGPRSGGGGFTRGGWTGGLQPPQSALLTASPKGSTNITIWLEN